MKTCAACHEDLPKDKFSKKQWKLNQRRCKECIADNREVKQLPPPSPALFINSEVESLLGSMSISDQIITPVSDEDLFKQPPPLEDCPICFLCMPSLPTGRKYQDCCGKERNQWTMKRIKLGDAEALFNLGCRHHTGTFGFSKDLAKALKLWHRAGEMGNINAHHNIGYAYMAGKGVGQDEKKAKHYWEQAAIGGDVKARYNLGVFEQNKGNMGLALKHFMIAALVGNSNSLKQIKQLFMNGHATKDDFTTALRSYQECLDDVKSDQRDEAAAFNDKYKYY